MLQNRQHDLANVRDIAEEKGNAWASFGSTGPSFRGSLTFQPQTLNLSIFGSAEMRYESGAQAAAKKAEIQEAAAAAKKARIVCFE